MPKQLLVFGQKTFKITVPDDAKITFGSWSPPVKGQFREDGDRRGTLRIYQGNKENIIACFSHVEGFRELSLQYAEQVAKEEGATIWKDDEKGYTRQNMTEVKREWVGDPVAALPRPKRTKGRK